MKVKKYPTITPQAGYDLWAASYIEGSNVFQRLETQLLYPLLPDFKSKRILDLGCGRGRVSRIALERNAKQTIGIDLSAEMLRFAALSVPSLEACWIRAAVPELPFRPNSFDVVICTLVLGHVTELEPALTQIASTLVPGGIFVITDFHPYATLRGSERTFKAIHNGKTYAIEQHLHMFQEYFSILHSLNFELTGFKENCYEEFPVVFGLSAIKRDSRL